MKFWDLLGNLRAPQITINDVRMDLTIQSLFGVDHRSVGVCCAWMMVRLSRILPNIDRQRDQHRG